MKKSLLENLLKDNFVRNLSGYLKMSYTEIAKELGVHKQTVSNWNSSSAINTDLLLWSLNHLDPETLHAMLKGHRDYYKDKS